LPGINVLVPVPCGIPEPCNITLCKPVVVNTPEPEKANPLTVFVEIVYEPAEVTFTWITTVFAASNGFETI
jgi:hypothetical protein